MNAVLSDNYAFMHKIEQLRTAEDFLQFFGIEFDQSLITAKRVVFLRLFRQVLDPVNEPAWEDYQQSLNKAYCLLKKGVIVAHKLPGCDSCSSC